MIIKWNAYEFLKIRWNACEFLKIISNACEFLKTKRNACEFLKIRRNAGDRAVGRSNDRAIERSRTSYKSGPKAMARSLRFYPP